MASALSRFGHHCRGLRTSCGKDMGAQAEALGCEVHEISSIETGRIAPSGEYLEKFRRWLNLNDRQFDELKKRAHNNVIDFRTRGSVTNNSTAMRLFRRISKMRSNQIRRYRKKIDDEVHDDR
jgi:transcriptional regulator with XRE-family HTH domain